MRAWKAKKEQIFLAWQLVGCGSMSCCALWCAKSKRHSAHSSQTETAAMCRQLLCTVRSSSVPGRLCSSADARALHCTGLRPAWQWRLRLFRGPGYSFMLGNAPELMSLGWHGLAAKFTKQYGTVFKVRSYHCLAGARAYVLAAAGVDACGAERVGECRSLLAPGLRSRATC